MLDVDRVYNVFNITSPPINTRPEGDDQELCPSRGCWRLWDGTQAPITSSLSSLSLLSSSIPSSSSEKSTQEVGVPKPPHTSTPDCECKLLGFRGKYYSGNIVSICIWSIHKKLKMAKLSSNSLDFIDFVCFRFGILSITRHLRELVNKSYFFHDRKK